MIEYNLKFVSLAAAYFNLIVALIGIGISIGEVSEIAKSQFKDKKCYWMVGFHSCLFLYSIMLISVSVTLVIGIKKKQPKLMAPFVYLVYGGTWMYAFLSFRHFVWGLWHRGPFAKLFIKLIVNLSCVSIQAAIFWPVYLLYRQWHNELREELKQQDTDNATKSKSGGILSLEKY
ncbi:uncharacterized protein LOC131801717 isoform X1 [Musca domestica]|uniref:Uncharacterized protein LOC131801717 isoform X1 n=1 Tax=Musca domestica TaxID=7370 RepID=A0ABM3USX7_MUSDO|nr:uncharacterized protein LOC131801717 isoform X1 [Musca domestica]